MKQAAIRAFIALSVLTIAVSGCDWAAKTFGKKTATTQASTGPIDLDVICESQFDKFYAQTLHFKKLQTDGKVKDYVVISKKADSVLGVLLSDRIQKVQTADRPTSDAEAKDPEVSKERRIKAYGEIGKAHVANLDKAFPEMMKTCRDTVNTTIADCNGKYRDAADARVECIRYYEKRVYWEMLKLTDLYKTMKPKDKTKIQKEFEMSFEENLKRQVASAPKTGG
jgi:hypothetical protein